jgi:CheY-like chemotaxis protein
MSDLSEPIILHVEDNPDDEMLVKRAFKSDVPSNQLFTAHDGREANAYLFEGKLLDGMYEHRLPNLILLDLKLPIMTGLELLEKIRTTPATQQIPVVVLTSSDEPKDLNRCYQLGVNSYVAKPVEFEKFIQTVRKIANYWLETNCMPWSLMAFVALL